MTDTTRKIAVLTGDIVGSTALGPEKLERAFEALKDCAEMQAEWMGESLHFTRHRGDGWQVALAEPKYALRSALAFRAALRAEGSEFDSYIGMAEGEISAPTGENLNEETAAVFIQSGECLEKTKAILHSALRFGFYAAPGIAAAAIMLDHISKDWTPAQAAPLLRMLSPTDLPSYTDVAKSLGKSRQSVKKSLDSAGTPAVFTALTVLEVDYTHV